MMKTEIISKVSLKKDPLLLSFVESFYHYLPLDYNVNYTPDDLIRIAIECYESYHSRIHQQHHITFENITTSANKHYTLIKIINDDMPFLVDSVTELLLSKKCKIRQVINALIYAQRDNNGKLVNITPNHKPNESFLFIKLDPIKDEAIITTLKLALDQALSQVRVAVADWQNMLTQLNQSISIMDNDESKNFLTWLAQDNFTFTGSAVYNITGSKAELETSNNLGIFKINEELDKDIIEDVLIPNHYFISGQQLLIGKIKTLSQVHKYTNLDYVCILSKGQNNQAKLLVFVGIFTSKLDYQTVVSIPLVREKVNAIIARAGFERTSFLGKELFSIIETLPRDELLQIAENNLYDISMRVLATLNNPQLLFFAQATQCKNFLNVMIFFPKSRLTSDLADKICGVIKDEIPGKIIHQALKMSSIAIAYAYLTIKVDDNTTLNLDCEMIQRKLDQATILWNEKLQYYIEQKFGSENLSSMLGYYNKSFPTNYQLRYNLSDAVSDIEHIEQLNDHRRVVFNLARDCTTGSELLSLKTYNLGNKIELSKIMPIIDNLGFKCIEENSFVINVTKLSELVYLQDCSLSLDSAQPFSIDAIKENMQEAILAIFQGKLKNDPLNKLIAVAGLTWRKVFLLSAYTKYILQMKFPYEQNYIRSVLVKHANTSKLLVDLFFAMFSTNKALHSQRENLIEKIKGELEKILDSAEDRVLRTMFDLIQNTLRTNFFQPDSEGNDKEYISFKLNSAVISGLPKPRPHVEIFVYSARMEGIHLRGGKVARGGIRWSDRSEDYRTEILGLMKAQMSKNSIIVPVGSKGGFLVKNTSSNREEYLREGIECYKTLLRGMLDITDNIVDGKVVKPVNVECLDEHDPYLVVAADKGTATFSDIANQISQQYNFWLGDAFASGGSDGYDHKKMGITAKGAWISVLEHFKALGINCNQDVFTAVGIGDMSGDVFGNGMLLSDNMKLVAAFNHLHIFIDPNPDPKASFAERKRLFELPRSNWTDYNSSLISAGGGVFERSAKTIKLSAEIQTLLDISENEVDPDTLIRKILTAKVDLLWNGGIGTYVKAETESHEEIGNKTNDTLRVNGKELRCRVVAEGGNLGFTQLARIEYEFNGGKINTDALDNSAGVDCSDHEVNIKIALTQALRSGKLSLENRNSLLASMTDEVAQLVLYDNKIQNQSISISSNHKEKMFESYVRLLHDLEDAGVLDRKVEYLPSDDKIAERIKNGQGFTRPELAVLMAYSKNAIFKELVHTKLADDEYFEKYLVAYFPQAMQKDFLEEILQHRLRDEIIITAIANKLVNYLGSYFYHIARQYTGLGGADIARAFCIVVEIFDLDNMWKNVESSELCNKTELFSIIQNFAQSAIYWFLRNKPQLNHIAKIIAEYQNEAKLLMNSLGSKVAGDTKTRYDAKYQACIACELDADMAKHFAGLQILYSVMDITIVAKKYEAPLEEVAQIYFAIGQRFGLDWLRYSAESLPASSYWQRMLIYTIKDEVYDLQRRLTAQIVKFAERNEGKHVEDWIAVNSKKVEVFDDFLNSIKQISDLDASKLVVAAKQIERLTK